MTSLISADIVTTVTNKVNVLLKDGSFNCLILDVMEGRVCQEEKRN